MPLGSNQEFAEDVRAGQVANDGQTLAGQLASIWSADNELTGGLSGQMLTLQVCAGKRDVIRASDHAAQVDQKP